MIALIKNCTMPGSKELGWYRHQIGKCFIVEVVKEVPSGLPKGVIYTQVYRVKNHNEKFDKKFILKKDIK